MDGIEPAGICARIRTARTRAGLTQPELARAIGSTRRAIANYERDRVPWDKLDEIAAETHADIRWLVFGEAYEDPVMRLEQRVVAMQDDMDEKLDRLVEWTESAETRALLQRFKNLSGESDEDVDEQTDGETRLPG